MIIRLNRFGFLNLAKETLIDNDAFLKGKRPPKSNRPKKPKRFKNKHIRPILEYKYNKATFKHSWKTVCT